VILGATGSLLAWCKKSSGVDLPFTPKLIAYITIFLAILASKILTIILTDSWQTEFYRKLWALKRFALNLIYPS